MTDCPEDCAECPYPMDEDEDKEYSGLLEDD